MLVSTSSLKRGILEFLKILQVLSLKMATFGSSPRLYAKKCSLSSICIAFFISMCLINLLMNEYLRFSDVKPKVQKNLLLGLTP